MIVRVLKQYAEMIRSIINNIERRRNVMKIKRIVSILIVIVMMMGLLPSSAVTVFSQESSHTEVYWGTSEDNLPYSGSWAEFENALIDYYYNDGNEVSYVKLNGDITAPASLYPRKTLTVDMAGYDIICENVIFGCQADCNFTIIDSMGGSVLSTESSAVLYSNGSVTVSGDITLSGGEYSIFYQGGTLDISGWDNAEDLTILSNVTDVIVTDTVFKLPDGYALFDNEGNLATSISSGKYIVAVENAFSSTVTNVDFNRDSIAYNEQTNTFYASDSTPFVLTVTGENLTRFSESGGLKALFKGETSNSGWVITNMTIQSDTKAVAVVDAYKMSYILNNSFGSDKVVAVMVENNNTQYGNTVYVNITHAPTNKLEIKDSASGTVEHNNLYTDYVAVYTPVTLTVKPDAGYMLESLVVDGIDVTDQVSGNTYTFIMPGKPVNVEATFKTAPTIYTVIITADKYEAVVGETVTLTAQVKANGAVVNGANVSWESTSGSGLNSESALTATITPEGIGDWTVTAFYDPTPENNENGDTVYGTTTITMTDSQVVPAITDVVISGNGVIRDDVNKTYTVEAGRNVIVTISGTNFDKITQQHYNNKVYRIILFENTVYGIQKNGYDAVSGNFLFNVYISDTNVGTDILYSNDGGNTWLQTGWKLVVEPPVQYYNLVVGGEQFTSKNLTIYDQNGGTATYDPDTNTLTLNNYRYTGDNYGVFYSGYLGDVLNIVLKGENIINADVIPNGDQRFVVVSANAGLVISGDGSLEAEVVDGHLYDIAYGIYAGQDITIKSGTITVKGGETDNGYAAGIVSINGGITIEDGTIRTTGGKGTLAAGIAVHKNITIKGGEIIATGGESGTGNDYGILSTDGTVTISGGKVTATGGENSLSSGLYAYGDISITGGIVTVEGKSRAINTKGSVTIGDGLGVYAKDGSVVENPDFNTLAYAKVQQLTQRKYMITWSNGDGGSYDQNVDYGSVIIVPDNEFFNDTMRKTGYTLTGWSNDDGFNVGDKMPAKDLTFTAQYTGNSNGGGGGTIRYTVKFETEGGTNVSNKSVRRNAKLTAPTAPSKDGFIFDGWYTDKELTTEYDFDKKVTNNFTLYAKWVKDPAQHDNQSGASGHNCPSLKFSDLDITKWYHLDTDYVIEKDIFRGTTKNTFTPDGNITRAMMITVLYRAEGEPEVSGNATFKDIDENEYYLKAVVWGQQNGIIKGYSETEFAPEQDIIREQIAAIMHRYAKYKGYDVSVGENTNILSYEDFDNISEYAIPSVQWAVGSGLIKGKSQSTLNPLDNATRAEIVAILHRFIESN